MRKYGCVLINQGDKLTKDIKEKLVKENHNLYGLKKDYIDYLPLPKASKI